MERTRASRNSGSLQLLPRIPYRHATGPYALPIQLRDREGFTRLASIGPAPDPSSRPCAVRLAGGDHALGQFRQRQRVTGHRSAAFGLGCSNTFFECRSHYLRARAAVAATHETPHRGSPCPACFTADEAIVGQKIFVCHFEGVRSAIAQGRYGPAGHTTALSLFVIKVVPLIAGFSTRK